MLHYDQYMLYKSQDIQRVAKKFAKLDTLPQSFLKSIKNYSPRLEKLLTQKNEKVFESDLEDLASYFQNHPEGKGYSPNRYLRLHHVVHSFHDTIREIAIERKELKEQKPLWKMKQIEQQLAKIRQLKSRAVGSESMRNIELIEKRANIRKTQKLSDRQTRAKEFVLALMTSKTNPAESGNQPQEPPTTPPSHPQLAV